jgi:cell division protein ZapA (FtsZ GTPase activity inhibitor)
MSRPVKVTLMGRPFTLQTDEDEAHVQRVARQVDLRLTDLRTKAALPLDSLALLVALTFADDLEKERHQHQRQLADLRDRAERLQQRLGILVGES